LLKGAFQNYPELEMILSVNHRLIYVHLYKCAGSSVEIALSKHLGYNDVLLGTTRAGEDAEYTWKEWIRLQKHSSALDIFNFVGPQIWSTYRTFATVRNPYSFAVSQYQFCIDHIIAGKSRSSFTGKGAQELQGPLLDESTWPWNYPGVKACMSIDEEHTTFSDFIRAKELETWEGFCPMYERLSDSDGRLLVDWIIKVEELNERWHGFCQMLGIPSTPLTFRNKSSAGLKALGSYYGDPQDLAFIEDRFAIDFEKLGYARRE
jgi:hypothetical protein